MPLYKVGVYCRVCWGVETCSMVVFLSGGAEIHFEYLFSNNSLMIGVVATAFSGQAGNLSLTGIH